MGFYKKTIVLSNQQAYGKGMAILTIEQNNSGVFGNIRVFDIDLSNNLMLGISVDGEAVIKQHTAFVNGNSHDFKLKNDFNINGKIGCVLVRVEKGVVDALVWGTNGNKAEFKKDIISIIEQDVMPKPAESKNVESAIQTIKNKPNEAELFETNENEIEKIIDKELNDEEGSFWTLINEQVNELFIKFPKFAEMEQIIPNSKWVKVDYNNDGKEYILGVIYEFNEVKYICYGVPGQLDVDPPDELKAFSQFVKIGDCGYWVMYQDATTGDSVLINNEEIV